MRLKSIIEAAAPAVPRDILVCIPAARLADVEREEAEVARRLEAGERNITYYWTVARLPKVQPRRIFFLWNGAVRAYHNVVGMEPGRIIMDPTIHQLTPTEMGAFRGWRYYTP